MWCFTWWVAVVIGYSTTCICRTGIFGVHGYWGCSFTSCHWIGLSSIHVWRCDWHSSWQYAIVQCVLSYCRHILACTIIPSFYQDRRSSTPTHISCRKFESYNRKRCCIICVVERVFTQSVFWKEWPGTFPVFGYSFQKWLQHVIYLIIYMFKMCTIICRLWVRRWSSLLWIHCSSSVDIHIPHISQFRNALEEILNWDILSDSLNY